MTYTYFKGYKAEYDYAKQDWFYTDTGKSATLHPRPCKKCGNNPTEEGFDHCLGNLGENVVSACCGHGAKKGYILFKDGRIFEEKELLE